MSSQNQNLTVKTVNNKMFIPQARFGDLLWSGVGNANFGNQELIYDDIDIQSNIILMNRILRLKK